MLKLLLQFPCLGEAMLLVHILSHYHHSVNKISNMYECKKVLYKFNNLIKSNKSNKKKTVRQK